jgi:hypothetical protein
MPAWTVWTVPLSMDVASLDGTGVTVPHEVQVSDGQFADEEELFAST